MHDELKKLSTRVWSTEKARFTAAERSRKKHQALVFSISFLSIVQVMIAISSICGFYMPIIDYNKSEYMTLITSVIILVIANQESLSILLNHADSYHRCGNKLHNLQHDIVIELANTEIKQYNIKIFSKRYNEILEFHDLNHTSNDYKKMMSEHKDDFKMSWFVRQIYKLQYAIDIYWLPILYCIIPFIIIIVSKNYH
jgi:hypothetical protein